MSAEIQTSSLADGDVVTVDDAAVKSQGGDGERTVTEFTRDEPFSMFALTWTGERDIAPFVRAQHEDGSWGPWYDAEPLSFDESVEGKTGTEPVYLTPTTKVQVSVGNADLVGDNSDPAPMPSNYGDIRPVAESEPTTTAADLEAVFIDGRADESNAGGINLTQSSADGMPNVVTRAGWQADESKRCSSPTVDDGVSGLVVHHTAGSNDYSPAQAAAQVRGIYQYHAVTLGWCDVGYNAMVDKYGTIYEGRFGGLDRAVQGAHAGGFNQNTWGVSMIGNHETLPPSDATIDAVGRLLGWRAAVAGIDPKGEDTHYSEGTSYTRYAYGTAVRLPNIFAHRDVGLTTCPGDAGYAKMGQIRDIAEKHYQQIESGNTSAEDPASTDSTDSANSADSTENQKDTAPVSSGDLNTDVNTAMRNIVAAIREGRGMELLTNPEVQRAAGTLAFAALTAFFNNEDVHAHIARLGDTEIIDGVTLSDIPALAGSLGSSYNEGSLADNPAFQALATKASPQLGNARSGVLTTDDGTRYALFDSGIILDHPEQGPQALWGAIGNAWAASGMDLSPLGLPVNEEHEDNGLIRVDFDHGSITFDPATGKTAIEQN